MTISEFSWTFFKKMQELASKFKKIILKIPNPYVITVITSMNVIALLYYIPCYLLLTIISEDEFSTCESMNIALQKGYAC